jgi:hypothetical protein
MSLQDNGQPWPCLLPGCGNPATTDDEATGEWSITPDYCRDHDSTRTYDSHECGWEGFVTAYRSDTELWEIECPNCGVIVQRYSSDV